MQNSTSNTEPTNQIPSPPSVETDDFGYDVEVTPPAAKPAEIPAPVVKPAEGEVPPPPVKKISGYGEETSEGEVPPPPAEVKPAEGEVPPPVTDEEKVKAEIKLVIDGLPANVNKEKVSKFAADNNLSKEQITAYAKLVKEESDFQASEQARIVKETRANWNKELKADPEFGGENYAKNVDRVEKVLEEYMVNTKKVLTERGGVLPPSTMKDLLAISKALNPTAPLVVGEAPGEAEGGKSFLDDLYQ